MKSKNTYEKISMNSIIVTPDKINDIQKNCIIPGFQDSQYKYIRPIGEGSYGLIYLVKDVNTNKEYALKNYYSDEYNITIYDNDKMYNGICINNLNHYYGELCTMYYVWKNERVSAD